MNTKHQTGRRPASREGSKFIDAEYWRAALRPRMLRALVANTAGMTWNKRLIAVLLEELWIDDLFKQLMGDARRLPKERYPQAVAVALLLRHSWRPDTLAHLAKQLGVRTNALEKNHLQCAARRPPTSAAPIARP
jgi:hypothetical protein